MNLTARKNALYKRLRCDMEEDIDFGPRLTKEEVIECISLSGETECSACGVSWELHHVRCEGSAI